MSPAHFGAPHRSRRQAALLDGTHGAPTWTGTGHAEAPRRPRPPAPPLTQPDVMEGFFVRAMKGVGNNLLLNHQLVFTQVPVPTFGGEPQRKAHSTYSFGAILVPGSTPGGQTMARCDVDDQLNVTLRGALELSPWAQLKANLQLAQAPRGQDPSMYEVAVQAQREAWNAKASVASGSVFQANALRQVTRALALGGEVFYVGGEQDMGGYTVTGRLTHADHTVTANWSSMGALGLTWLRKYGDKVSLWSSLDVVRTPNRSESVCQAGYDASFRMARVRGSLDSNGVVKLCLEERITPGTTLTLSAEIDHAHQSHKFGLGVASDPMSG